MKILALLLVAWPANAGQIIQPRTFAESLQNKLHAVDSSASVQCADNDHCKVQWTDDLNMKALTAKSKLLRESLTAELTALGVKMADGTATPTDMRRAIQLLILLKN